MFGPKNYVCVCHGCGTIHVHVSSFLSVPMLVGVDAPDGQRWCLPALGCLSCREVAPGTPDNPIRKAWEHGMTPEAIQRAQAEFKEKFETLPLKG